MAAAEKELGYQPEIPLERGLAEYAAWLKEHED
jgi:nucleoside-diphosphate-sugar epimerase